MLSVPDDHRPDYDNGAEISALRAEYPAPWVIRYEAPLRVYSAELRSENGHSLHYLCGFDVPELRARLEVATMLDSGTVRRDA